MKKIDIKFKYAPIFNEYWEKYGFTQEDKKNLQNQINNYGKKLPGSILEGTGGAYKFRFASKKDNQGKSGSYRTIYVAITNDNLYFLAIYAKSEKSNLSKAERNALKATVKRLRRK
ncbi:RelE toxin of RelE / RelB toxin-antitoxin system [Lactobacillus bombicola]|uniref:RelE toxin of RelE / RelB toxin-antitoxin system n=2 Tax=Lactobacillus bombicola TaxID=1505723 RepID=A0A1I1TUM3_9LACO|nr:type II toxin-antitoxin system RelE/ParE family toxin [Lactobacillus bombicola]SFD62075.1 RelE toxin of RelE / RelB toxin-antitoxin system [Lactobacillus bombicola]